MTTLAELALRGGRTNRERVAVTCNGQSLTFSEVDNRARRVAGAILSKGIQKGEPVAVLMDNGPYSMPTDFGLMISGINKVPLNSRLSESEHLSMLEQTGCRAIIAGSALMDRGLKLANHLDADLIPIGGDTEKDARHGPTISDADLPSVDEDDVLFTLFTSGTTGALKAAIHTQGSGAAICRNVLANLFSPEPDDAMLHAASLIHASGVFVMPFWLRGARTVIMPSFDPATYLKTLADEKITAINVVPTMLYMVMTDPAFASSDRSSVNRVIYGASPMPRNLIETAMAMWPNARFWQYYGQTEAPLCISVLRPEQHTDEHLRSCGQITVDVDVRIVDQDGKDAPAGEKGEIIVRSLTRMQGYHDAPELNAETLLEGGWIRTRDVGQLDEEGFLTLIDRTSDMIVTGGYNVYPREVEDVLAEHPAVLTACVVGAPDEQWVEAVSAVVVLNPGADTSEDDLIAHVGERLASHKKPKRVAFWDALPRTLVGKLDRKAVRQKLAESS